MADVYRASDAAAPAMIGAAGASISIDGSYPAFLEQPERLEQAMIKFLDGLSPAP